LKGNTNQYEVTGTQVTFIPIQLMNLTHNIILIIKILLSFIIDKWATRFVLMTTLANFVCFEQYLFCFIYGLTCKFYTLLRFLVCFSGFLEVIFLAYLWAFVGFLRIFVVFLIIFVFSAWFLRVFF
jgi:hypothetical protein